MEAVKVMDSIAQKNGKPPPADLKVAKLVGLVRASELGFPRGGETGVYVEGVWVSPVSWCVCGFPLYRWCVCGGGKGSPYTAGVGALPAQLGCC